MAFPPKAQSGEDPRRSFGSGTAVTPALPICISFRYRDRQVLCAPLYRDDGFIGGLTFLCPSCGQMQKFGTLVLVGARTGLTTEGCLRCLSPGCGLYVTITNGQATDVPRCG